MSPLPTKVSEKLFSTLPCTYPPETMEPVMTRGSGTTQGSLSPAAADDYASRPNPRSPSFSTDFLERNAGKNLAQEPPLRVHSLVRKLGSAALAQTFEDHEEAAVAAKAPFVLRPGILNQSDAGSEAGDEPQHEPEPEYRAAGAATDGFAGASSSSSAAAAATTPPAAASGSSSAFHGPYSSPAGASSSAAPAAATTTSVFGPSSSYAAPSSSYAAPSSSSAPSVPSAIARGKEPAFLVPDAAAPIRPGVPSFPRGIGPAPGESGFATTKKKKKSSSFSFSRLFRSSSSSKAGPSADVPVVLSAAQKRANAAKERDARIKAAEAEKKRKAAAAPTDIAPSKNPVVVREQKAALLARKKGHLREAKAEAALAVLDVELLQEGIAELEWELS